MKNLLIALLFLPSLLQSQSDYAYLMVGHLQIMLYGYDSTSEARMGFMDANGKVVIEPKYISCSDFKEGIANVIRPDGTYGIVDKSGKETWFPGYEKVYFNGDDFGITGKDGKWGFLDKKGEIAIPLQYEMVMPFNEGYAPVKIDGKWAYIDKKGRFLLERKHRFEGYPVYRGKFIFAIADTVKNGKEVIRKGLLNKNGKVLVPAIYDNILSISSEGLCWVARNGKNGIVNHDGKEIVPCEYTELKWDAESDLIGIKENGLWGFWNIKGKRVIPPAYNRVYFFSEGLAAVEKDGKVGFIDENNNVVIPFQFLPHWTYKFSEGLSPFKNETGKHGYINKKGEMAIPPKYDAAIGFDQGLGYVKLGDRTGFVDKNGVEVIPLNFKEVWQIAEGMIRFAILNN